MSELVALPASQATLARESRPRSRGKRLRDHVLYALVSALVAAATWLPRWLLDAYWRGMGIAAYALLPKTRRRVRARLSRGLGGAVPERRVRAAFLTAGATLADTLALFRPRERAGASLCVEPESREVFRAALAEGRGVVFVSAHLGSWERMAALLAEEGFPAATVARQATDPRLTLLYERLRAPRGVRSIYRGQLGAAVAIARELREGRAVGFLLDLPARVRSADALLFGAMTPLPIGAARIALARGAAVVVGVSEPPARATASWPWNTGEAPPSRLPAVRIRRVRTDDLPPGPDGARSLLERLARALEGAIQANPEGWLGLFVEPRKSVISVCRPSS